MSSSLFSGSGFIAEPKANSPRKAVSNDVRSETLAPQSAVPATEIARILLVDDESRNLDVLESILQSPDYGLVRVQTPDQALMALLEGEFAAIVMDVQMPGMTGFELANLIKQRKRTQYIPIIFLTAYYQADTDVLRGYSVGAVDYLTKPVSPDVLRSKVAVFVELFRKSRALAATNAALEQEMDQRQQVTARLREMNIQLEEMVYSIAHDLRGPLRAMEACSQLMLDECSTLLDENGKEYAQRINKSAVFMDKLLLDLLEYGRTSRAEIDLTAVQGQVAWEHAVFQCQHQIREKNALIEAAESLPTIRAHEGTLGQVLANLLNNALRFVSTDVRPHVRIRAENRGEMVRLWVEDNGIGIAPEHHERIFRVFERLNGGNYGGTGVGLAIVRKGVERMGGRVGVESQPGEGSRFWIELAGIEQPLN